jgi:O-antigen/teichoic acid export membrane protein
MDNVSEYSVFAKRVGLVGVVQTLAGLKGLLILPILTKVLGASDYGIWATVLVTVALVQPLIKLGLDNSILRFLAAKRKEEIVQGVITTLCVVLFTGAIASLALFFSSDLFATTFLKEEAAASVIRVASCLLILETMNVVTIGSFRVFGQIKRYSVVTMLQTLLEIGLVAFFVLSGHGLMGAVIALIITKAVALAVALSFIISHAGLARPDFSVLPVYFRYGLPLVPTLLFEFVIALTDRYVIGGFLGAASVGAYSAAYGIGSVVLMFSVYIMYILRPTVFKGYDEGRIDTVKTYLSYSWKYLLMLSIPAAFGLTILSEPLLASLTTAEFVATGKFIIPLVAFSMIIFGMEQIFGTVVLLSKRSGIFPAVFGAAAAVNLGLNLILIPRWGVITAAVTTLIAYALAAAIMYQQSRKYMKFRIDPVFITKSVLASGLMALAIWAFQPVGALRIALSVVFGAAIYFAVLLLLRGFTKAETGFVIQFFKETVRLVFRRR